MWVLAQGDETFAKSKEGGHFLQCLGSRHIPLGVRPRAVPHLTPTCSPHPSIREARDQAGANREHSSPFRFPVSTRGALRQQERTPDEGLGSSRDLWPAGSNWRPGSQSGGCVSLRMEPWMLPGGLGPGLRCCPCYGCWSRGQPGSAGF